MKLRPFELALIVVFLGLTVLSLAFLSIYKAKPDKDGVPAIGTVTIWGTLPQEGVGDLLKTLQEEGDRLRGVSYRHVSDDKFDTELVNALADGAGPDVVLVSHERLVELRKRIQPVSYEAFPLPDIRSKYIDGAQIFALTDGLYAYPIAADPLVMYWNKDILTSDGFLEAPKTWEALTNDYLPKLVRRNPDRTITRSVVAMGEYDNVQNSFGLLSTLLLQAGTFGVTEKDAKQYAIKLDESVDGQTKSLRVSADFYTRFSRPNNSLYSWNRSFEGDKERFLSEELALYFGYGSEGVELEQKNPNLNFDVAEVPQGDMATVRRTYANFYGLSALRASKNLQGASQVMAILATQENTEKIAGSLHLVPVYKASVAKGSNDIYGRVSYKSAAVAYGWLSPSRPAADSIFKEMTQDLNENRGAESSVISDALSRFELEYN
jgi:ABC-type glycerol-3-phosphate transport system substrate-binding protein